MKTKREQVFDIVAHIVGKDNVSKKKSELLVRLYNNYREPIGKTMDEIIKNPNPFLEFVLDHYRFFCNKVGEIKCDIQCNHCRTIQKVYLDGTSKNTELLTLERFDRAVLDYLEDMRGK